MPTKTFVITVKTPQFKKYLVEGRTEKEALEEYEKGNYEEDDDSFFEGAEEVFEVEEKQEDE